MEVTESLAQPGTPLHSLNVLEKVQHKRSNPEHHAGTLGDGSGAKSSGTYARPC